MPLRFSDKVCLITGAGSGIGRATAGKMALLGARLALSDINIASLIETKSFCGRGHIGEAFDIADSDACNGFVLRTVSELGRLDYVFNCAGVHPTACALTETTDAYWDKLPEAAIVNVSSMMGVTVAANYAIYCATKWGIIGFTKAMAMELGPKQIRVNAVAPGYINSPSNAAVAEGPEAVKAMESQVAMGRVGTPEEVADVVAFLFSEESRYMSGSIVEITGGRI